MTWLVPNCSRSNWDEISDVPNNFGSWIPFCYVDRGSKERVQDTSGTLEFQKPLKLFWYCTNQFFSHSYLFIHRGVLLHMDLKCVPSETSGSSLTVSIFLIVITTWYTHAHKHTHITHRSTHTNTSTLRKKHSEWNQCMLHITMKVKVPPFTFRKSIVRQTRVFQQKSPGRNWCL
jgi:hypothetical protein